MTPYSAAHYTSASGWCGRDWYTTCEDVTNFYRLFFCDVVAAYDASSFLPGTQSQQLHFESLQVDLPKTPTDLSSDFLKYPIILLNLQHRHSRHSAPTHTLAY
jgi:hypothetical protein